MKALLIEHERLAAKSIKDLLSQVDIEVVHANGDSAIQLAQKTQFDLIISKLHILGKPATELIKQINSFQKRLAPFFLITDYADYVNKVNIQEADRMGCSGYFWQPFDAGSIYQKIRRVVDTPLITTEDRPVIAGQPSPSIVKRFFYNALSLQWNPEKEVNWNASLGFDESLCDAMTDIISPIVMGEYSAVEGIPPRILAFKDYEVKQYLSVQLVDETRHSEAFSLYLARIHGQQRYRKNFRNIHALRFFNALKKLKSVDEWIAGLFITEILSHVLLSAYAEKIPCVMTQHLFKMIIADENRHISFGHYYLREISRSISDPDRRYMVEISVRILRLTEGMVHSYGNSARAFGLDPQKLFERIKMEINSRFVDVLMKGEGGGK